MDELALLIELHRNAERQGPGGDDETRLAIALSGLAAREGLAVADIGCGTGASTLVLARELDARITAVDFLSPFLERLEDRARDAGLADRIETLEASMGALPFEPASLDAIWSEGAIYNLGFARGIAEWRQFLKPGGVLAVSELTWLTQERPADLEQHWMLEYAEVDTASAKIARLEAAGYTLLGYFALPERCWLANYYRPLQARFDAFLEAQGRSAAAIDVVAAEQRELALYERFSSYVSYGFFVARRLHDA